MAYQELEVLCIKMQKIEDKYPTTYLQNTKWQALSKKREELSKQLVETELEYQKQKVERLKGRDTEKAKTLIGQYERYLKKRQK